VNERGYRNPGHYILWGIVAFVIVAIALVAIFHYVVSPVMMPVRGYYYGDFWPFFPLGIVGFFIFLFLIFGVLRWVFWGWGWRRWGYGGYGGYYADPKQILKRRYARGEITKDQFEQMMRDLEEHS
jgi:putative membrane protein